MWNKTRVTKVLDISYPIIQGPFGGGYSTVQLVSTISNAGGLGSFGAMHLTPAEIVDLSSSLKGATNKPYAINLWVSSRDEAVSQYREAQYERLKSLFKPYFDELRVPLPELPQISTPDFENQVEALLEASPPVFSFIFGVPSKHILHC